MVVQCANGVEIKFEETPYYFTVTVGGKTWYWDIDTGKFSGTSVEVKEEFSNPVSLPTP